MIFFRIILNFNLSLFQEQDFKSKMLLQVHDELIFEAPEDETEKAIKTIREVMENAAHLSVPLIADAGIGDSWADAH